MDIEEKINRLEVQFISTNVRITELCTRLAKVEELIEKYIVAQPHENHLLHDHVLPNPGELYQRISKLASDFNKMLPELADVLDFRTGVSKGDCYCSTFSVDKVKAEPGGRMETAQPNPACLKHFDRGNKDCSVVTNPTWVPVPNETESKYIRNTSNASKHGKIGADPNIALVSQGVSKANLNYEESGSSQEKLKRSDEDRLIFQNGPKRSQIVSSTTNASQKLNISINKSQEQLPDVPLTELLSKLVNVREPEPSFAASKAFDLPVIKKSVSVFEENPWEDELDKIPWEGTDNLDSEVLHQDHDLAGSTSARKRKYSLCTKTCANLAGHSCKKSHDPSLPCPPCTVLIKNFKLKCNHRVDVMCHRQAKINEYCSECDARRLAKVDPEKPSLSRPSLSLAMDPIQSESEIAFKKVKEILNKLTSSNFEKLSDEFMAIVNAQTKYLPEIAGVLIEKAMLDVENPLSPANYAKLASKTINRPQGELKMFRIEVVTLAISIFTAVLFPGNLNGAPNVPNFVNTLLKRKEISDLDPKRRNLGVLRFVGELFNQDVISMTTMQTDIIDRLIANPTEENLDYLCKLLTLVGLKIHGKVNGTPSFTWFEGVFIKLKPFCDNSTISTQVRFSIRNVLDLHEVDWDRFKKTVLPSSTSKSTFNIGSTTSLLSNDNDSSTSQSISTKPKRSKKKKQALPVLKQEMQPFPTPLLPSPLNSSDVFDPWESAPWGEHTDPLAVAFPRLDSPAMLSGNLSSPSLSGKATPSDAGWVGSQASFAKALSNSSSRVISPAISTTSLNSANSSLPSKIDAVEVFHMYMSIHTDPQKNRIDLLRRKLAGCEVKQLRDLMRDLSRHILKLTKKVQVAAMGQMIDVLLKAKIVTVDLVSKGFQSGVITDLPIMFRTKQKAVFEESVSNVATVVVTIWSERMSNFSWLFDLGRNIIQSQVAWDLFSSEVITIVLERKKHKFTKKCFDETTEGQDCLRKQALALKIVHK